MTDFLSSVTRKLTCKTFLIERMITMEEHTVDLLRECDSGCAMAAESLEQIRDFVSDQGLWNEITASYEKHQDLDLRIKKTLSAMEEQGKEPGKMASAWSWMSTEMRMMAKGGDKEAASIVTDGCNMGIKTICGYKNQYSGASKAAMELADELTGMEENLRDHMKKFLSLWHKAAAIMIRPVPTKNLLFMIAFFMFSFL